MKIFYIALAAMMVLSSCNSNRDSITISKAEYDALNRIPNQKPVPPPKPEYPKRFTLNYSQGSLDECYIILIDGCEYISYHPGCDHGFLTHKGDCKFCLARQKQMMEEAAAKYSSKVIQ